MLIQYVDGYTMDMGDVVEVSEVNISSSFRVELCRVDDFVYTHKYI
jgi:hypothetical protein